MGGDPIAAYAGVGGGALRDGGGFGRLAQGRPALRAGRDVILELGGALGPLRLGHARFGKQTFTQRAYAATRATVRRSCRS